MQAVSQLSRPAALALSAKRGYAQFQAPQPQRLVARRATRVATVAAEGESVSGAAPLGSITGVVGMGGVSAARIVVQGRNVEATPAIKAYCEDKVGNAIKHFDGVKEVDVKLSVRGNPRGKATEAHHQREQTVEITLYTLRHGAVRVEDSEDDLYAAVDLVADKLKRKLVKVKERAVQKGTWPGSGGPKGGDTIEAHLGEEAPDSLPTDQLAPPVPEVVREKLLVVTAMTQEEAMERIENVGHDFFIFKDSADGGVKVLYRRKSHGYGVIVPKA